MQDANVNIAVPQITLESAASLYWALIKSMPEIKSKVTPDYSPGDVIKIATYIRPTGETPSEFVNDVKRVLTDEKVTIPLSKSELLEALFNIAVKYRNPTEEHKATQDHCQTLVRQALLNVRTPAERGLLAGVDKANPPAELLESMSFQNPDLAWIEGQWVSPKKEGRVRIAYPRPIVGAANLIDAAYVAMAEVGMGGMAAANISEVYGVRYIAWETKAKYPTISVSHMQRGLLIQHIFDCIGHDAENMEAKQVLNLLKIMKAANLSYEEVKKHNIKF